MSKEKKILILANNDVGLYKFRKELIQVLIEQGNKVYISLPYGKLVDSLINMGCEFIDTHIDRRGINPIEDLKLLINYKKIIKAVNPDLVITYTVKPNIYGGIACRIKKTKYISNITGLGTAFQKEGLLKKIITTLYKLSLKKVKCVFFENKGNRNIFTDLKIVNNDRCVVMNGAGVNLDEYTYEPMPANDKIRFLFIGRVMKEKGVDELFYTAEKVKNKYPNVEFDIVGPFEEDYKERVDELEKKDVINYYGYQEDVRPFIQKCHCFVLPSYHEGMANTLLEAGAMGRPIIASNIHGCKEAVIEEKTGLLCEVKSKECIYNKIERFINFKEEEKVKMGLESRNHIEKLFNKEEVVSKTLKVIERCI